MWLGLWELSAEQGVTGLDLIVAGEEEPMGVLGGLGGGSWKAAGLPLL